MENSEINIGNQTQGKKLSVKGFQSEKINDYKRYLNDYRAYLRKNGIFYYSSIGEMKMFAATPHTKKGVMIDNQA